MAPSFILSPSLATPGEKTCSGSCLNSLEESKKRLSMNIDEDEPSDTFLDYMEDVSGHRRLTIVAVYEYYGGYQEPPGVDFEPSPLGLNWIQ